MCAEAEYLDSINKLAKCVNAIKRARHELAEPIDSKALEGILLIEEGIEMIEHTLCKEMSDEKK